MAVASIPESDAQVFLEYFSLIKWHVARAKIDPQLVEDYSMFLMEKFIAKGLLKQYNPELANFRTFVSGYVTSYLRGFKAQDLKRQERSLFSTDFTVGDGDTPMLDLKGYHAPDKFEDAEMSVSLARIREKIKATGDEKFLLFFDFVVLQVEEHGQMEVAELAELFGVTRSSIHNWRKRLRPYFTEAL